MDEIARNDDDYEGGDDPPEVSHPKEEHQHQPSKPHKKSEYSYGKFARFWQRHSQQWKDVPVHDKSNAIFTIVIAVATTIYAFVTISQLTEMRTSGAQTTEQTKTLIKQATAQSTNTHDLAVAADTQSKQAIEQNKKMAESITKTDALIKATNDLAREAKRSADVARDSLDASSKTFHLDQRPWIMGARFELSPEPEAGKPFTVRIYLTNTGKTTAINVTPQSRIMSWHEEPPLATFPPLAKDVSRGILAPGTTQFNFQTLPLTLDDAQLIGYKFGTYKIYVHARISYTDIFEKHHWTSICVYHGFNKDEWAFCSEGNDADH
jgi:hypothetical protein